MKFDFSKVEGLDPDLVTQLSSNTALMAALDSYRSDGIEEAVNNRVEVAKGEFKKKMDALNTKLEAAEAKVQSGVDIDADELKALREAASKSPELQATLDAMKTSNEEATQRLEQREKELLDMQRESVVTTAIHEYNTANPNRKVNDDAHDLIQMLSSGSLKYDETSKTFQVFDGKGAIIATNSGAAKPSDWVESLLETRPSMFAMPSGGGASGSDSGSANNTISRADFDKLSPVRQGEVATTHQITD